MKTTGQAVLLRIFVEEQEHYKGKPLYEHIVEQARSIPLAGATVVRGIMGFGSDHHLHSSRILSISLNLPVIVEIIDTEEQTDRFLERIDGIMKEGLVTKEHIDFIQYRCPVSSQ